MTSKSWLNLSRMNLQLLLVSGHPRSPSTPLLRDSPCLQAGSCTGGSASSDEGLGAAESEHRLLCDMYTPQPGGAALT